MYQRKIYSPEDSVLLVQVTEGDRAAFDILYERHFNVVYNSAYKRLKDADQAADIAQEVFVQLWLRNSKVPIENLSAYLFTLVRNNVFKFMERERRYEPLPMLYEELEGSNSGADAVLLYQEFLKAFEQLIESLTPQQRIIFKMRYEDDLTAAEIAHQLDLSPKTVRNQLGKALNQLRASFSMLFLLYFLLLSA